MISSWLSDNPLAVFALLLGMPDLVGLLVAGVLIGPHGLQWLNPSQPTVQLLSDGGVIYLLFLAGLEIDLAEFARIRQRSLRFGLLTFSLPMLGGLLLGLGFGYSLLSAVLIGSILSSHTPLGYPIVRSYGAMGGGGHRCHRRHDRDRHRRPGGARPLHGPGPRQPERPGGGVAAAAGGDLRRPGGAGDHPSGPQPGAAQRQQRQPAVCGGVAGGMWKRSSAPSWPAWP